MKSLCSPAVEPLAGYAWSSDDDASRTVASGVLEPSSGMLDLGVAAARRRRRRRLPDRLLLPQEPPGDDYGIIDFNLAAQSGVFSTAGGFEGAVAVPEPATLSLAMLLSTLRRRRRDRKARNPDAQR